ncbi:MAG: hypothetical protein ACLSGB_16215 [Dorea sp.]
MCRKDRMKNGINRQGNSLGKCNYGISFAAWSKKEWCHKFLRKYVILTDDVVNQHSVKAQKDEDIAGTFCQGGNIQKPRVVGREFSQDKKLLSVAGSNQRN